MNMWSDSWVCLLARNLVTPCLGREPKARVATSCIGKHFSNNSFGTLLFHNFYTLRPSLLTHHTCNPCGCIYGTCNIYITCFQNKMQHIECKTQALSTKGKWSWACWTKSWKMVQCWNKNLFPSSQYIVYMSNSQSLIIKMKSQMKVSRAYATSNKPYTDFNKRNTHASPKDASTSQRSSYFVFAMPMVGLSITIFTTITLYIQLGRWQHRDLVGLYVLQGFVTFAFQKFNKFVDLNMPFKAMNKIIVDGSKHKFDFRNQSQLVQALNN